MELKSIVHIEIKKNDRTYVFALPVGAPFGEAYDAAFEVLGKITEFAQQAAEQARPKEVSEAQDGSGSVSAAAVATE